MTIIDYTNKATYWSHFLPVYNCMAIASLSGLEITRFFIMNQPTVTKWQRGLARFGAEGTRHG